MHQGTVGEEKPRGRPFPSIRTKLAVYFSLMAVAILIAIQLTNIVGIPFTAYSGMQGQQRTEAFRSLELVADLNKERLLRLIEQLRDDIRVAANNSFTAGAVVRLHATLRELSAAGRMGTQLWDPVREDQDYRNLLQHLDDIRSGIYSKLAIIEAETGMVFVSTDGALQGVNFSREDFFTRALGSGDAYIGDIRAGALDPQPSLYFSHAISNAAGEVVAVLAAAVSADDIIRPMLYTGAGLGERGEVLLINQDVRSLLSLKHPLADETVAEPLAYRIQAQPAVRAARGQEGIIEDEDYRREPVLAAYRYIPVTAQWGWGMVVKRDWEELFAPLRLSITYSSAIGLLGILALVVLTVWLASRLTRPILALSQTAVQAAQGDLDARALVTTSDEVGYLATTFNTMLQRIEERTEELAALNKELEAFSYSISHDLQTPLRAIDGFSRILVERHADKLDAEGTRLLGIIRSNTQQMGQLIHDLLAFARLGRQEMNPRDIDMGKLATAVFAELQPVAPDRNLQSMIGELPPAHGDPAMIRQVLVNLLSNAIKFSSPKDPAVIEVGHRVVDHRGVYYVRDNGVGFDMQYAHKLFGVFQRLHTTEEFEGTGVGLAIVQRIIQRHGGRVWAEGRVNEGATIYFTLPRPGDTAW